MKYKEKKIKKRTLIIQLLLAITAVISLIFLAKELNSEKSIKVITVEGNNIVPGELISEEICRPIVDSAGKNLKLENIRSAVNSNPFIKNSIVVRDGAEELNVVVQERRPIALICDSIGNLKYIDEEGVILPYAYVDKFPDLALLRGFDPALDSLALSDARKILNELMKAENELIYNSISEIVYNRDTKGFSMLSSGFSLKIIFGKPGNFEEKVEKLMSFWKSELKTLDVNKIEYIDLRWAKRLILKTV